MTNDDRLAGLPDNVKMAEYRDTGLVDYRGNPLIEALPPIMSEEEAEDALTVLPMFKKAERSLPAHLRYHCLMRLSRYFVALNRHIELEKSLSVLIRQGYIGRNPFSSDYIRRLNACHELVEQQYLPSADVLTMASGFTFVGISGSGKTRTFDRLLLQYPQVIVHKEPRYHVQLTWLKINSPYNGTAKQLAINILAAIDRVLDSNYYSEFVHGRSTGNDIIAGVCQVAHLHSLGVLVIDEMQRLNFDSDTEEMLRFLLTLMNVIGVPVILISTPKILSYLEGDFPIARRCIGLDSSAIWERFNRANAADFDAFKVTLEGLWGYQWLEAPTSAPTPQIIEVFYDETQGIVDILVKLFMMAQARAIATGKPTIELDLIRQVAQERLKIIRPMIQALRSGNAALIKKYEDIKPVDITEMVLLESSRPERGRVATLRNQRETPPEDRHAIAAEVIGFLAKSGIGEDVATVVLDQILTESPDLSPLQLMQRVMETVNGAEAKLATAGKPRQSRAKRKAKADVSDLPDGDLRKIVMEAKAGRQSAYDVLKAKGFIKDPLEEFYETA